MLSWLSRPECTSSTMPMISRRSFLPNDTHLPHCAVGKPSHSKRTADDGHAVRSGLVRRREVAPFQERNAEHAKVVLRDGRTRKRRLFLFSERGLPGIRFECGPNRFALTPGRLDATATRSPAPGSSASSRARTWRITSRSCTELKALIVDCVQIATRLAGSNPTGRDSVRQQARREQRRGGDERQAQRHLPDD